MRTYEPAPGASTPYDPSLRETDRPNCLPPSGINVTAARDRRPIARANTAPAGIPTPATARRQPPGQSPRREPVRRQPPQPSPTTQPPPAPPPPARPPPPAPPPPPQRPSAPAPPPPPQRPSALVGALSGNSLRREGMGVRAAHWPHVLPPQNLPRVPPRDRRRRRAVRAPRPARRPRARRTHLLPWLPAPRPPRPRAAVPGRLHGSGVPGSTPLVLSPYRRRPRSTGAPARSRGTRPVPGCPP